MATYTGFNNSDISINYVVYLPCTGGLNSTCSDDNHLDVNDTKFRSKLSPTADIISGCYILIVCILSVLLNVLVIVTVIRRRRSVSPLEIYIINMAVLDLCPTVLSFPATSVSAFKHGWVLGDTGCMLSGFSVYFFGIAGITNLTVMSIMRYFATCRHKSETINRRLVILTLIPIYGNAALWCITPMVGWGQYGPEKSGISCALEWHHLPLSYVITCFTLLFAFPVIIIIFCYSCIIREVYITQKGTKMVRKRMDIYMIKMTIMMTLCFLVAWTPYSVVAFLATKPWLTDIPVTLVVVAAFMAKSSSLYNPLVYVFTVKRFRQEMTQVLCITTNTNITMATHYILNDVKPGFHNQKESESLLTEGHMTQYDQQQDNPDSQLSIDRQEKGPLVISEVTSTRCDLNDKQTLPEMPYMGPYISEALSKQRDDEYSPIKKDTQVVLDGMEND